jgi:miniconductance mechanosensitive channel
MPDLFEGLINWFEDPVLHADAWGWICFAGVVLLALVAKWVSRKIIQHGVERLIRRSRTRWDNFLYERKFFGRLSHVVPAVIVILAGPQCFRETSYAAQATAVISNAVYIYLLLVTMLVIDSFLHGVQDIYNQYSVSKRMPIRSFLQIAKLVLYIFLGIWIVAILIGRSPVYFLTGLGAMTAVLLIIFRDAILGFVAGITLTTNDMVRLGDWIEMPNYGANGDVIDVSLASVKVRNWDKTITTIPTYALISDSFKNWRGMQESGGRRISRAVNIDMNSVRFCSREMLEKYKKIRYIREYIERKEREVAEHNAQLEVTEDDLLNGRHLTNLGTLRAYLAAYLHNHPRIHKDMTFLVRQLAPTEHGLPMEIYVFTTTTAWAEYEGIQSDIFDHVLAILPEFDLRVHQTPTGRDLRESVAGLSRLTQS